MTTTYTSNELNQYRLLETDEPEIAPGLWFDADGNLCREFGLIDADTKCDGYVDWRDTDCFVAAINNCGVGAQNPPGHACQ